MISLLNFPHSNPPSNQTKETRIMGTLRAITLSSACLTTARRGCVLCDTGDGPFTPPPPPPLEQVCRRIATGRSLRCTQCRHCHRFGPLDVERRCFWDSPLPFPHPSSLPSRWDTLQATLLSPYTPFTPPAWHCQESRSHEGFLLLAKSRVLWKFCLLQVCMIWILDFELWILLVLDIWFLFVIWSLDHWSWFLIFLLDH